MKLQSVTKLPASTGLVRAVRQGNKVVHAGPSMIAGLNLSHGAEVYTFPQAYALAMGLAAAKEFLRYQAWLQANSVVPAGVTCWKRDPKPHARYGVRWDSWVGARHEYKKRANTSRTQPNHKEPVTLKMPVIFRDANWYLERAYDELHGVILARLTTMYDDKGRYLPAAPIAAVEHEGAVTQHKQGDPRDYTALRIRDKMRSHSYRLTCFFEDEAKQARYSHLCTKYKVHPARRFVTGNMMMFVAIKPENQERHIQLSYDLMHKFNYKPLLKDRVKERPLPHVESATGWLGNLPYGQLLVEAEENKKAQLLESKMPVAEEPVVHVAVDSPTQLSTQEKVDWHALGHSDHEYGIHLKDMADGQVMSRWERMTLSTAHEIRANRESYHALFGIPECELRTKATRQIKMSCVRYKRTVALKVGTMGYEDMVGPPTPPKLSEQYKLSSFAALVYGARNTSVALVQKKMDTDQYLKGVGGPSAFVQDEQSGLYLPPSDFDEDLPSWKVLSSSS